MWGYFWFLEIPLYNYNRQNYVTFQWDIDIIRIATLFVLNILKRYLVFMIFFNFGLRLKLRLNIESSFNFEPCPITNLKSGSHYSLSSRFSFSSGASFEDCILWWIIKTYSIIILCLILTLCTVDSAMFHYQDMQLVICYKIFLQR